MVMKLRQEKLPNIQNRINHSTNGNLTSYNIKSFFMHI